MGGVKKPTPAHLAARVLSATFLSRSELAACGAGHHDLPRLIAAGTLVRLRNGRYARADVDAALLRAGRLGGRLDCLSLLEALGVFVAATRGLHVQFSNGASRLPSRRNDTIAHWRRSVSAHNALAADLVEALAQSVRCQNPRDAVATLDSAWHHGLVGEAEIDVVFARLPLRYRHLRRLLDPRSESGPETIMRLMLRGLGCRVEVQVKIAGVGRVDLVVDGWLIVECDSKAHHEGWEAQRRDRARDLAAAALGYTTVRPIAEDILYHREQTLAAMKAVLAHRRPASGQNSSRSRRQPVYP